MVCGGAAYGGEVAGTHMPFSSGRFLAGSISRQTCWPPLLKNADIAPFFPPRHQTYGRHFPPAASAVSLTKERPATTHPPFAAVTIILILLSQLKYYY